MTQFEIIMRTDTPELPAEIGNFADAKAAISEALTQYNTDAVVDADSVKDAEKTRAHLRKVKEQIETYRKDAKAAYLDKFTKLETQCKELSALIEQPITAIDGKIKEFEDIQAANKFAELTAFFDSINSLPWLKLERILNPKWKNKGMTVDKLKTEIGDTIIRLQDEYKSLQAQYGSSQMFTAIANKWMENLNLSQTLVYAAQLERQHSEEQKRAEDIQKAREEQTCANALQNAHTDGVLNGGMLTPENEQNACNSSVANQNKVLRGKFEVECEKDKLIALVQYMKTNGIKYSVVKE